MHVNLLHLNACVTLMFYKDKLSLKSCHLKRYIHAFRVCLYMYLCIYVFTYVYVCVYLYTHLLAR